MAEPHKKISSAEFIALTALLLSLVAMAIDAMLPALGPMGAELSVADANDSQLVIAAIFVGLAIAQIFYGPLSDTFGRKPVIHIGLGIFMVGCAISIWATSFTVMLLGRVLQGVGAAGPKIVTMAMVRDQYKGDAMARVISVVLAVFIVVPALAPSVGQGIMLVSHWRGIFVFLLLQGVVASVWFALRQPETLAPERRMPLSLGRIVAAIIETCRNRTAFGYTLASGLIFGSFLGYLNSAQQIFQVQYEVGDWFPTYFGGLAVVLGCASIFNARMVLRLGMFRLSMRSVIVLSVLSVGFSLGFTVVDGHPPLWGLLAFLVPAFFCIGILFGNFNAMAMEPLGHIAGTAAAVIASLSTLISLGFGVAIGRAFDNSVLPLVYGMAGLSLLSLPIMIWVGGGQAAKKKIHEG